jgi:hypothetical protein
MGEGAGRLAEGTGRGLQKIARIAKIAGNAKIEKRKTVYLPPATDTTELGLKTRTSGDPVIGKPVSGAFHPFQNRTLPFVPVAF